MEYNYKGESDIFRRCLIITVILLILAAGISAVYCNTLGRIGTIETAEYAAPDKEDFETDEYAGSDTITPGEIKWADDSTVLGATFDKQSNAANILVVGKDAEAYGEQEHADAITIVSLNWDTGDVNVISVMRDLYVQIPGYSDNRITAAYRFGGTELLDETIEKNFGIHIDYNVEFDFTGFEEIINDLGGIYITLTEEEASYFQDRGYDVRDGYNHFWGALSLEYARTHYVSAEAENDDVGRIERQRTIIKGFSIEYENANFADRVSAIYQILGLTATDMTDVQMISLLYRSRNMDFSESGSYRIPVDNGYTNQTVRGMMVLVPDLKVNRDAVSQMISGTYEENWETVY